MVISFQDKQTSLKVSPTMLADLDEIVTIEQSTHNPLSAWSRQAFVQELSKDHAQYLTLWKEKTIIGYIGFWSLFPEIHITNFVITQSERGKGYGAHLLDFTIQWAEKYKYKELTLEVRESNQVAQGLYHSRGFSIVGSRPNYYRDTNETALIMTLTIVS